MVLPIFLSLFLLFPLILAQITIPTLTPAPVPATGCRCGGTYVNGRAVTGCVNDRCPGNATASTRCVVIYRQKTPIGYDCIPWPSQVADCAVFDDGSRVCASDVCHPNLLGGAKGDCAMQSDFSQHALIAVQVTKSGLEFAIEAARKQGEVEIAKLKIPDQAFSGGGFDVKVTNIRISQFEAPNVKLEFTAPSTVKINIQGGDFKACATWEAKALFINPGGDLCAWSEKKKGVDIELVATITIGDKGQLQVTADHCRISTPIDLSMTGAIGAVVSVLSGLIEGKVESMANEKGCGIIKEKVATTLKTILEGLPQTFKFDSRFGLAYSIRSLQMGDFGIRAQMAANGTFTQQ